LLALICAATFVGTSAIAAQTTQDDTGMKKWYAEGNVGYVLLNPVQADSNAIDQYVSRKTQAPIGLGVNTGYQFNPFIAVEAGFNYFFSTQRHTDSISGLAMHVSLTDMYALTFAGKATMPLSSTFSAYGKLGLAYTGVTQIQSTPISQTTTSVGDVTPMFGAGVQVDLKKNLYAQLGWMMIPGKQGSCSSSQCTPVNRPMINTFTGGLGYRFG
jgi:opacity protein-like surface antigen